jgi:hypothetical protein
LNGSPVGWRCLSTLWPALPAPWCSRSSAGSGTHAHSTTTTTQYNTHARDANEAGQCSSIHFNQTCSLELFEHSNPHFSVYIHVYTICPSTYTRILVSFLSHTRAHLEVIGEGALLHLCPTEPAEVHATVHTLHLWLT